MKLFDVYPLNDVTIVKALGSYVWDDKGTKYLDLYGGHAVISIGHTNPHWVKRIEDQLHKISFYSNSIKIPLQVELAEKLGKISLENAAGSNNYRSVEQDAVNALVGLGIGKPMAESAVKKVLDSAKEILSLEDIIKQALKNL